MINLPHRTVILIDSLKNGELKPGLFCHDFMVLQCKDCDRFAEGISVCRFFDILDRGRIELPGDFKIIYTDMLD